MNKPPTYPHTQERYEADVQRAMEYVARHLAPARVHTITCPYCRSAWTGSSPARLAKNLVDHMKTCVARPVVS